MLCWARSIHGRLSSGYETVAHDSFNVLWELRPPNPALRSFTRFDAAGGVHLLAVCIFWPVRTRLSFSHTPPVRLNTIIVDNLGIISEWGAWEALVFAELEDHDPPAARVCSGSGGGYGDSVQ